MKKINTANIVIVMFLMLIFNTSSYSQLNGNYTIGNGGNFPDINSAAYSLMSEGISGPVTFSIKPGNYYESVLLDSVRGSSPSNTIVFKTLTGITSDVKWYPLNSQEIDFTLSINKADFVTVQNISFPAGNPVFFQRNRIVLSGNTENLNIIENNFTGDISKDNGIISSYAKNNYLTIKGNTFNLKNGIVFLENSGYKSNSTYIAENSFNCSRGIEIRNHDNLFIEKNDMRSVNVLNAGYPSASCIRVSECNGSLKIIKNQIKCFGYTEAIDGIVVSFCNAQNALVANNFIFLKTGTGMWIEASSNVNVCFNTVKTGSVNSGDITFVQCAGTSSRNNIMVNLANQGTHSLTYFLINSEFNYSDYNVFFYNNPFVLYGSQIGYMNNLQQFTSLTGYDLHSLEIPVYFVSDTNLHLAGTSLSDFRLKGIPLTEVTDDIDGNPRNLNAPTIGAHENYLASAFEITGNKPENFSLQQNYPNPFNPVTQIIYEIPVTGFVTLKVFDILGKEITTLVDEIQNSGIYKVTFNSENLNLAAGIYFYSLNSGEFRSVRKMSLIK